MGFLDRLRGIRQEATKRLWATSAEKNAPPTFVSDFILEGAWDRNKVEHLAKMSRRDASAWALTHGLAANVFDDGFFFVKKGDEEQTPIMLDVMAQLEELEANKYFTLACAGERWAGHTWEYIGTVDVTTDSPTDSTRLFNLDVFTPEYATATKFDDVGRPTEITIKVLTNTGNSSQAQYQEKIIKTSDCILWRTRPYDRSHEGLSVLWPVWNALCGLNFIFHSITMYDMKIGMGALILKTKNIVSDEDMIAAQRAMHDLSVTRVAVIPGDVVESLGFEGAGAGATDFDKHIAAFREEIAAGSKYPKDVLTGANAGAITGSEVNSKALYAVIQGIQSSVEGYIRETVRRLGHNGTDYDIVWNTRYATDEMQQAQIRVLNAQADEAAQRIEGMKKGKADFQIGFQPKEEDPEDKEEKDNNPSGRQ